MARRALCIKKCLMQLLIQAAVKVLFEHIKRRSGALIIVAKIVKLDNKLPGNCKLLELEE